ncbi:MAG TPA: alpha/beta hydrolase [Cyclobacteriaceae bacterium]|nr:alpha/beta hydrolase [Cyclobacteriaceae bacterium]
MPETAGVFYTDQGQGFPVVLIHGFCETHEVWKRFAPQLSKDFRVISVDLPGFGSSKSLPEEFTIADAASKINALLIQLDIKKSILIGHSLGGYVTLAMVNQEAGLFSGFGLFHSTAYADSEERKTARNKVIEFVSKNGVPAFIETFIPPLFHDKANPDIPFAVKMALQTKQETLTGYARAMRDRPDLTSVIKKSDNPILFIAGEKDTVIPPEALQKQAEMAVKPQLHVVQNAAHMAMFEKEAETLNLIRGFLVKSST